MSSTLQSSRVTVLIKALPQPSKRYGETVCCAGVTPANTWKRLYPVRFRHLQGEQSFSRWDIVEFRYREPNHDRRIESCHVYEDSITIVGKATPRERSGLVERMLVGSAREAASRGQSLAIIRPKKTRFITRLKSPGVIEAERAAFKKAAGQFDFFDKQLAAIDPSPYHFAFHFLDSDGSHTYQCGDWEVHAMFYSQSKKLGSKATLEWMLETFNVTYPRAGMTFALGNVASRPQTWQLLGVVRADESQQHELLV